MINQEWHQCSVCHRIYVKPEIEYKADPYRSSMMAEGAPVWICQTCFGERQSAVRKLQNDKHIHSIGVFAVEKAIIGRLKAEVKRIS